ncbi:hypothetical protein JHK82_011951 [Glycine max]|uniref:RNase H type-1 domain-containing protein n=2 Tax=Glycine subgen. Soja TaxID=1462606 RepID=A0A0R0JRC5_SOYBN|nr:hypothetical protein JHK87_011844 [Glycine soja]KAG5039800.1 hypothetical protein JHK85_012276 [Glycine max]KAG5056951.1 hypothetical protein JHK86_011947 [Glycine max]KAG5153982.1 hypothetical protein JHK82_011951 [Glycine max]KAH1133060.1 hypothetical protein GYH30_011750 [Glycine max]
MPNHIKQKFAVTLWCIWRCRNEMIWEDKEVNPITAFSLAYQYFAEWCIECQVRSWKKPEAVRLKCNVDAVIFNDHQSFGLGVVLRDEHGSFISVKTSAHTGILEPIVVETVIDDILNFSNGVSDFHVILGKCREALRLVTN